MIGLGFDKEKNRDFLSSINTQYAEKMDLEIFNRIMNKEVFPGMGKDDLLDAFRVFDKNNTGRINTAEF